MQEIFVDELYDDGLSGIVYTFDKFVCDLRKISPSFYMEAKTYVTKNIPFNTVIPVGRFICVITLDISIEDWKMAFVDTECDDDEARTFASILKSTTNQLGYDSFMNCFRDLKPHYRKFYGDYELVKLKEKLSDDVYRLSDFIEH